MIRYRKTFFDPAALGAAFSRVDDPTRQPPREDWAFDAGAAEQGPARHFVFAQEAVLALNVALATGRPLLVSGEPGSGKTSLARFAARALGRVFYRETVTSRTQASDLLASYDTLRRLSHAQVQDALKPDQAYVVPGKLWWALSPQTAAQRGRQALAAEHAVALLDDPGELPPGGSTGKATLLLDEIDKADPDVPNDLLESLDERRFTVRETGDRIEPSRTDVLILLTTNGERELPPAFLRRCVALRLPDPDLPWLLDIARRRFGAGALPLQDPLYQRLADKVMALRGEGQDRRPPSTSEFVDAVAACRELLEQGWIAESGASLDRLLDAVLGKQAATTGQAGQTGN